MPELGEIRHSSEVGYKAQVGAHHIWAGCESCGKARWVQYVHNQPRAKLCLPCSRKIVGARLYGDKHHKWRGGYKDRAGYKMVKLYPDDFFFAMATNIKRPYVMEHRLVMAKYLSRCLLPWEVVHHKNGIKDDNRIENLELLTGRTQHLVDVKVKSYIGKLEAKSDRQAMRIAELEGRVTLLEAENALLCKTEVRATK